MKKVYSFKIYYRNGKSKILGGKGLSPESLYAEFDGMISWEEYDKIACSNLTVKDLLSYASKIFKNKYKDISRIEIVNIENNEIVDFVDC